MAKEKIDFSLQLEDIPTPQGYDRAASKVREAGALEARAGELAGKAGAVDIAAKTELGKFAFENVVSAVKGYGQAEIETTAEKALAQYEDNPEYDAGKAAAGALKSAAGGSVPSDNPALTELNAEADRYRKAMAQGKLSRDEVVTRIAASVKKWSARLPGMAADFRKVAADKTGISDIDTFELHKRLTTKSAAEEAAKRAALAAEKYDERVSIAFGIPPAAVTDKHRGMFAVQKQLDFSASAIERDLKVKNMDRGERALTLTAASQNKTSQNFITLMAGMTKWTAMNNDPSMGSAKDRDALHGQLVSQAEDMKAALIRDLTMEGSKHGIDVSKQVDDVIKQYDNIISSMKTTEGWDILTRTLGRKEQSVKLTMANFKETYPALELLKETGVLPVFANLAMTDEGMKNLSRILGPDGAKATQTMLKDTIGFNRKLINIYGDRQWERHGAPDLANDRETADDPATQHAVYNEALGNMVVLAQRPKLDDRQTSQLHRRAVLVAKNLRKNPQDLSRVATNLRMTADQLEQKLTPSQKKEVAMHLMKVESGFAARVGFLQNEVAEFNRMAGRSDHSVRIEAEPNGGVRVEVDAPKGLQEKKSFVSTGFGGRGYFQTSKQAPSEMADMAKARLDTIKSVVGRLNSEIQILGIANGLYGDKTMDAAHVTDQVVQVVKTNEASKGYTPLTLRATQQRRAGEQTDPGAITEAGKSANPKDDGVDRSFIMGEEGSRDKVYPDSKGIKTIGIGFNLEQSGADKLLSDALGYGKEEIAALKNGDKSMPKKDQEKLFEFMVERAVGMVKKRLDWEKLTPGQRTALVSLAYNGGEEIIGDGLVAAVNAGDQAAIEKEILERSGTKGAPELAGRRKRELERFRGE